MRVYKAVESVQDRKLRRIFNFTISMNILFVGVVVGMWLAFGLAVHYLVPDLINPNKEVGLSAFCVGGLVPEPDFCAKSSLKVVSVAQMQPFGIGYEDDYTAQLYLQPTDYLQVTQHYGFLTD